MIETVTLIFGGIIGLYVGAELLVFGGASLTFRLGLPLVVIGLVVVGYGTGTPELIVSLQASLEGRGDIAIGNVIGSNIANNRQKQIKDSLSMTRLFWSSSPFCFQLSYFSMAPLVL